MAVAQRAGLARSASGRSAPVRAVKTPLKQRLWRLSAQAEPQTDTAASDAAQTAPDAPSTSTSATTSSSSSGGFLATRDQQAAAYGLLSATSLAFGAVALAFPNLLVSVALGAEASNLDVAFTRIAGATMAISAATEYSIRDAVLQGHLKSATYQRLMLAVICKSVLYMAAFLLSPDIWNPVLISFYPTAAAASIAINVATLQSAFQQSGAQSFSSGLTSMWGFSTPKTPASWGYTVAIGLYLATVAACYSPEVIFTGQPMTPAGLLLKHTWAPGFLLAAGACWVLKDAADRSRLGASTFKRLNLGLAAVEAGYSAVFAASIFSGLAVNDASAWSNLAGSLALVAFCGWQSTAKK